MYNILVVEDDKSIAQMIEITLDMGKYSCTICEDGDMVRDELTKGSYQLILLDVMLPGIDGFSLMEYIRPLQIPVIFITAKHDVTDRVKGLKLGAEDYILKPFDSMELLARIEVVFRRYHSEEDNITYRNIEVDKCKHKVFRDGIEISFTPKEFDVLIFFLKHQDIVIRKERLMSAVWGFDFVGETRTIDIHIQHVRKKLHLQEYFVTIPKVGYRLKSEGVRR